MSTEAMRACGCGLRRILPTSIPGSRISEAKTVAPATFWRPSSLGTRRPTIFSLWSSVVALIENPARLAFAARQRGRRDHLDFRSHAQSCAERLRHILLQAGRPAIVRGLHAHQEDLAPLRPPDVDLLRPAAP